MLKYASLLDFKMKDDNGNTIRVRQVTKRDARKAFDEGKPVWLLPSRMNICNPWQDATPIEKKDKDFDAAVNEYKYYNCNGSAGNYPHYFVGNVLE